MKLELRLDAWTAEQAGEAHRAAKLAEIAAADAAAQAEAEAAKAAKGGGKGGKGAAKPPAGKKGDEPPPEAPATKEVLSVAMLARTLAVSIGLPAECLNIELPELGEGEGGAEAAEGEEAAGAGGLQVWVRVKPMLGLGLQTLGVDGAELPAAAMGKLERLLQMVL
eukprot:2554786-Prymnesium_polylepis.1